MNRAINCTNFRTINEHSGGWLPAQTLGPTAGFDILDTFKESARFGLVFHRGNQESFDILTFHSITSLFPIQVVIPKNLPKEFRTIITKSLRYKNIELSFSSRNSILLQQNNKKIEYYIPDTGFSFGVSHNGTIDVNKNLIGRVKPYGWYGSRIVRLRHPNNFTFQIRKKESWSKRNEITYIAQLYHTCKLSNNNRKTANFIDNYENIKNVPLSITPTCNLCGQIGQHVDQTLFEGIELYDKVKSK